MDNKELEQQVIAYMNDHPVSPLSAEELAVQLNLSGKELGGFWQVLKELEKQGIIVKTRYNTYGLPRAMGLVTGRCQVTSKGFAFVVPLEKNGDPDLFIPASALTGAMDGDTVIARVSSGSRDDRPEGKIIRIVERAHHKLVGTFTQSGEFAFVIPDNKRVGRDIYVRRKDFNGAQDKEKVVVEITTWPDERRNAEGKIVEILGKPGDIGLEILSIIKDNDLPTQLIVRSGRDCPRRIKLLPGCWLERLCRREFALRLFLCGRRERGLAAVQGYAHGRPADGSIFYRIQCHQHCGLYQRGRQRQ